MAFLLAPLIDILAYCAAIGAGFSLRDSHIEAFALAVILQWLLQWRAMSSAQRPPQDWRLYARLLAVALMALFLRGGILALLTQRFGWPPQAAIFLAVAAGLAVTLPGFSYAVSRSDGESRRRELAYGLIAFAALLRVVYAGSVELLPEETYYWNYAQHPDIGYLDHPPMVAWLIRLGTGVFGQSEFAVRFGAFCCGAVASVFVYRLARNLYGARCALAALLLAQALPFFFLSGMLMTPDAPLTATWAAALYFLERALIADKARAWWFAGLSLGIGMISKYSIALLVPVTFAFMIWDPAARRWFRRPQPYLAVLLAAAIFSPVILWNAQHDWISFAFQTSRRLVEPPRFALHKLLASMLVLLTPTGLLALIAVLMAGTGGGDAESFGARRQRFLRAAILIPLSVFAAFSLRHEVKLDWTGTFLSAALPILGYAMIAKRAELSRFAAKLQATLQPTLVVMLLAYGAGLHYLVLGLPGVGFGKHIELFPVGWRDLSAHIMKSAAAYREESGGEVLLVGMDRYAVASELAFYGGLQYRGLATANSHLFGGMGLMYGLWMPSQAQEHKNLLLVALEPADLEDKSVAARVERLGPVEDVELRRDGKLVRHYYYRRAYNYRSVADP